jgi:hypothetical protein
MFCQTAETAAIVTVSRWLVILRLWNLLSTEPVDNCVNKYGMPLSQARDRHDRFELTKIYSLSQLH